MGEILQIDLQSDQVKHLGEAITLRGVQQGLAMNHRGYDIIIIYKTIPEPTPQFQLYGIKERKGNGK